MIEHHPSETTLLDYASGALAPAHRTVTAVHAAHCPRCALDLRALEAAAGAMLEDLPAGELPPVSFSRMLARLDAPAAASGIAGGPPTELAKLATGRWRWCGPGLAMMRLMPRDDTDTRLDLLRARAGMALLDHGHDGGFETTVVLQGRFEDERGSYGVGDLAEAQGAVWHRPRALPGVDCICLIATTGHLTARSLLGRIVRPLLGM